MSNYDHEALQRIAIEHAHALCGYLAGDWHRTDAVQTEASIAREDCELYLWGYEQDGTARLSIRAQLPDGWAGIDGVAPPEITVRADRSIESIATDIARRLLPAHAERAAQVRDALEREEQRKAITSSIVDYFLETMPGGVPDMHHPATAVSSRGPGAFSASMRLGLDVQSADLHLRNLPLDLTRSIIHIVGRHLSDTEPADGSPEQVLNALADTITKLAGVRTQIPTAKLLRESALNLLIISRIASNRLQDRAERDEIEQVADQLITTIRHRAWSLPPEPLTDSPATDQAQAASEATDE
ncbi:hypothetical protein [Glycomyces niveus]|uniref:Uncharacterized protein n=1 Tax=Glycomyces niveus TaxID=2820287 RepID=A0ABS3U3G0_9ACTN|nr:hypothetical protein [Glycomyces sp. NEAU-S30]MBO3732781.1 hypothetical protein [Glycomyces sp. NEAU-S30]